MDLAKACVWAAPRPLLRSQPTDSPHLLLHDVGRQRPPCGDEAAQRLRRQPPGAARAAEASDGLVYLVQAINPVPAYIRNSRLDILAWNPAIADLFVDYGKLEPHERNTLRLMFLYPPYRSLMRDWEQMARGTIRVFHAARAKAADKAPFDRLVEDLCAGSEEFRTWWPEVDVQGFDEGGKRLRHPTHGLLDLTYVALTPEGQPDLSLVTYIPRPGACDLGS